MTNPAFLQADVANLVAEIDSLFAAYPELAEDDQLKQDMIEGSTAVFDVLTRILNQEREADSMSRAIASRISDLQSRKARADRKKEAMRALMLRIMRAGGIQKAPLAEATVSVSKGRDSVDVVDVNKLPDEFVRIERVPDKRLLLAALANDNVPGAALVTGGETITVRVA